MRQQPLTSMVAAMLAACTGYAPQYLPVGASAAEVQTQLGQPTGRYELPQGGARLEFARGPYGKHTYMVDLDSAGKVIGWQQVLNENNFNTVVNGMSRDEVLFKLGRPSERRGGGRQGGEVWSYRYDAVFCQWFAISMIDGKVRDPAYLPDPLCDNDNDNDGWSSALSVRRR